jgi:hypothetical protein
MRDAIKGCRGVLVLKDIRDYVGEATINIVEMLLEKLKLNHCSFRHGLAVKLSQNATFLA